MELFLRNEDHMEEVLLGQPWARFVMKIPHALRRNSRTGSKKNVSQHYDLGNEFYRLWLDPGLTYSSAIFSPSAQDLAGAQRNKYRILAQRLGVLPGHHVLELGCGWGGFAEYLAKEMGARVTAITISAEQHKFAQSRIQHAGLSERVEVLLKDYRDVTGIYDRIASIEMLEAVGEGYWPEYFGLLNERLKPGGRAGLQVITIDEGWFQDYRTTADFIQKYVFPGGMLPTKSILARQTELAGMHLESLDCFGADYMKTLRLWQVFFQAAWPDIEKLGFDSKFKRIWELYLAYCEAGFAAGTIDVVHAIMTKY
jgi:cyclopropane-fatty-acyl-phospholipid synthase